MTYGELFCGIGGIGRGLEAAGMTCRFQVEIDPFARKVLDARWPDVPKFGDITKVTGDQLGYVDVLAGGFPCVDLSYAGKQQGFTDDAGAPTRSGLWFEFARLIGEIRPRYVLAENVPGLLVPGAFGRVLADLARIGYVGCWRSLRASEFGASHLRKRIFICAYLADSESEQRRGQPISLRGRSVPAGNRAAGNGSDGDMADAGRGFIPQQGRGSERRDGLGSAGAILPDANSTRSSKSEPAPGSATELHSSQLADAERQSERAEQQHQTRGWQSGPTFDGPMPGDPRFGIPRYAPGPSDPRWPDILRIRPDLAPALANPDTKRRRKARGL